METDKIIISILDNGKSSEYLNISIFLPLNLQQIVKINDFESYFGKIKEKTSFEKLTKQQTPFKIEISEKLYLLLTAEDNLAVNNKQVYAIEIIKLK